jgi:hypothetical protein
MADSKITISLEVLASAAQKALDDLTSKGEQLEKGLKKTGETGGGAFEEVALHIGKASGVYDIFAGNLLANLAVKGLELLSDAAHKLFEVFGVEGIKAAADYQQSLQALNVGLATSGNYSAEASKGFAEYAHHIQETTKFSESAVLQGQALLASLTGLSGDGLKKASDAAIEFSARSGKDLGASFLTIAKAAEGNTTALKKFGIDVQVGATNADTFSNTLSALSKFTGSAAAETQTYSGAVTQNSHAFEDVQKSIGNVIVQNPAIIAGIKAATGAFSEFADYLGKNKEGLKELAADGFLVVIDTAGYLVTALDIVVRAGQALYNGLQVAFNGVGAAIAGVLSLVSDKAKPAFEHFKEEAVKSANDVNDAFTKQTGLQSFAEAIGSVGNKVRDTFGAIKAGADGTIAPINNAKGAAKGLATEFTDAEKAAKALSDTLSKESLDAQKGFQAETAALKTELEKRKAQIDLDFNNKKTQVVDKLKAEKKAQDDFDAAEVSNAQKKFQTEQDQLDLALSSGEITQERFSANLVQLKKDENVKLAELEDQHTKNSLKYQRELQDAEKKLTEEKVAAAASTAGNLSSLMKTSSRELYAIGKAAALAQATINTYQAITATMASTPYPYNIPLAIAQGVAGAVQVANIASQNPSFEAGGIVPGNSFTGDKVQANVNSGEMILNRQQQANLFKQANGSGGQSSSDQLLAAVGELLRQPITVNIDGQKFIDITRDQLLRGRSFA